MTRKYRELLELLPFDVPVTELLGSSRAVYTRWFSWREIAWEDEVVVITGTCGRCGHYEVLVELDRQLVCSGNCLKNEERSIACLVDRNPKVQKRA
jgi:hypothetical protein